jgi:hypothetical protein
MGSRSYREFLDSAGEAAEREWLRMDTLCASAKDGVEGVAGELVCDVTGMLRGERGGCLCEQAQWQADARSNTLRLLTPMPLFGYVCQECLFLSCLSRSQWGQALVSTSARDSTFCQECLFLCVVRGCLVREALMRCVLWRRCHLAACSDGTTRVS